MLILVESKELPYTEPSLRITYFVLEFLMSISEVSLPLEYSKIGHGGNSSLIFLVRLSKPSNMT